MEDRFDTIPEASSDIQIQLVKNGGAKCTTQTGQSLPPIRQGLFLVDVFPVLAVQQPREYEEHHKEKQYIGADAQPV